jgi:hypothetical protein
MDPNAALRELREAIHQDDTHTAAERFEALDEWLSRGGYLPERWQAER